MFVNSTIEEILELKELYALDLVQLHGDESPDFCESVRKFIPVIKTFLVGENFSLRLINDYSEVCDYFLFDTQSNQRGGSGEKFDPVLLNGYNLEKEFFFAGGIQHTDRKNLEFDFSKFIHFQFVESRKNH